MNINQIATVNVFLQTAALTRAGFGTIAIFGDSSVITGTKQIQTIEFSADLVTGNDYNLNINGVAITEVPFNTNNATTLTDIAEQIEASDDIFRAVSDDDNTITVTTVSYATAELTQSVVTGGASQATTSITETQEQVDEVRTYTSIEGVAEDFSTSSTEYKKALAAFSQSPRILELKIARRRSSVAQVVLVSVKSVSDDTDYNVNLNGNEYTFNSGGAATETSIVAGLVAAIAGGDEPISILNNGTTFRLTADNPGESIDIETSSNLSSETTTDNQGIASDILRANQVDPNFYFIVINTTSDLDIKEAAKTTQALEKLFFAQTSSADVKNNVAYNVASILKGKSYTRVILSYTDDITENRDATYAAAGATSDPGSITWVYKSEAGATAPILTATQEANLTTNNVNYQVVVKGQTFSFTGKVSGGDFIDTIRGIDFFTIRLQEDFLEVQLNSPKIPYNNAGIQTVAQIIGTRAQQCIDQGIFNSYEVIAPDYSTTLSEDRLARRIRVDFQAVLQGAIQTLVLNANVTV